MKVDAFFEEGVDYELLTSRTVHADPQVDDCKIPDELGFFCCLLDFLFFFLS